MKNYFIKGVLRALILIWLLSISSSLFAISFNEPRKVIIPQFVNAVYRDLTVLDTMSLGTKGGRTFLMEIGKRPSYFWSPNNKFYLYQNQSLELENVAYNDTEGTVFFIDNVDVAGSFISNEMFFNGHSSLTVNNNATLFMNYQGDLLFNIASVDTLRIKSFRLENSNEPLQGNVDLYLRDVQFNGKKFPSPRLSLINYSDDLTKTEGTSLNFELAQVSGNPSQKVKQYYGPWEIIETTDLPLVTAANPCSGQPNRCYTCKNSACVSDSDKNPDTDNDFICAGTTSTLNPPFDPGLEGGHCYDYNVVTIQNASDYNNNGASYEFKVQEIYSIDDTANTATLVEQNPRVFDNGTTPFWTYNGSWNLNTPTGSHNILINGSNRSFLPGSSTLQTVSVVNPCYEICNKKSCSSNRVYLRNDSYTVDLSGGANSGTVTNLWPDAEGPKQHLIIATFTVGFCPSNSVDTGYEPNRRQTSWEGLRVRNKQFKACFRRQVRCDFGKGVVGENKVERNFTLLSTDY